MVLETGLIAGGAGNVCGMMKTRQPAISHPERDVKSIQDTSHAAAASSGDEPANLRKNGGSLGSYRGVWRSIR
jgi:hypothetical protein